jgi:hypothetical protein
MYRRYATECLKIAQCTTDERAKRSLFEMAVKWHGLAVNAEQNEKDSRVQEDIRPVALNR